MHYLYKQKCLVAFQLHHALHSILFHVMAAMSYLHPDLEFHEEPQVLLDSESIKEDIVLWTDAKTSSDLVHPCQDAVAIDDGVPRGGRVQASEDGHGGGLAGTIVTQQGSDLVLVHVQGNVLHCHLGLLWLGGDGRVEDGMVTVGW